MKIGFFYLCVFAMLFVLSCRSEKKKGIPSNLLDPKSLVADTIIYDVIIKNTNPDDEWKDECLKKFSQKNFIDKIFKLIYSGKLVALDYMDNRELKVEDIKAMENSSDFDRKAIGKIQFNEAWFFDTSSLKMEKKVHSLIFGKELFFSDSTLRGYQPLFIVKLY